MPGLNPIDQSRWIWRKIAKMILAKKTLARAQQDVITGDEELCVTSSFAFPAKVARWSRPAKD